MESAAARPPAATRAVIGAASPAISGLASTMMSRSTFSSLAVSGLSKAPGANVITPSPFLSLTARRPVSSQAVNHSSERASWIVAPATESIRFVFAKAATAGAVV